MSNLFNACENAEDAVALGLLYAATQGLNPITQEPNRAVILEIHEQLMDRIKVLFRESYNAGVEKRANPSGDVKAEFVHDYVGEENE